MDEKANSEEHSPKSVKSDDFSLNKNVVQHADFSSSGSDVYQFERLEPTIHEWAQ